MKNNIYLDYAATTPVDNAAFSAALPYYKKLFYNPSSSHACGQLAAAAVERAREKCAAAINASPSEIYFTSGGTEAVNLAFNCAPNNKAIAVSAIEHDCATECALRHEKNGGTLTRVMPTADGIITPESLKKAVGQDIGFTCVIAVNNIVGSIQPIKELAAVAHECGLLFFTDAVQAVNCIDIDVKNWGVDMLALSGHKFYAPKGVGMLYVKNGIKPIPMSVGGDQERGVRAGTLDVPAIVAMGVAIEKAVSCSSEYRAHVKRVSEAFLSELKYGTPIECGNRADDIVSVSFAEQNINGGRLAVALSLAGVCCSVGSACSAGSATPPPTLVAMGVERPACSVRFSFGRQTTVDQAVKAARIVNRTVERFLK